MARLVYKYERIPEGNEVGLLESVLIPLAAWEACHSRHLNRLGVVRPVA